MSAVHRLLDELAGLGASVERVGEHLIVHAGPRVVPAALIRQLSQAKPEVLAALVTKPPSAIWGDAEEERAAIIEHDAGASRDWAEALVQLFITMPPSDVPRWTQFLGDCCRFLDSEWAERVEGLGWRPLDLFGCDRTHAFAHIDTDGLLWLINGGQLITLTENAATIESSTGDRQSYRRKPAEPGKVVLGWEKVL